MTGLATRDTTRRPAYSALVRVLAMLLGLVVIYGVFVLSAVGQRLDISSFGSVDQVNRGWGGLAGHLREDLPVPLAALVAVLVLVALVQRRWRGLLAAAILLLVPYAAGHELKTELLDRPYLGENGYTYNTFPSGHTIVLASLLMTTALLLPRRLRRPASSVGLAALTVLCGLASVVSYAHRPSDIVSALLIVGVVAVLAGLVAGPANAVGWPGQGWPPVLWAAGASVLLYVVLWLALPYPGLSSLAGNLATLTAIGAASFGAFTLLAEATGSPPSSSHEG